MQSKIQHTWSKQKRVEKKILWALMHCWCYCYCCCWRFFYFGGTLALAFQIISREFNILFIRMRSAEWEERKNLKDDLHQTRQTLAYITITVKMLPLQYLECRKKIDRYAMFVPLSFIVKYDFIQAFWSVCVFVDWNLFDIVSMWRKKVEIALLYTVE